MQYVTDVKDDGGHQTASSSWVNLTSETLIKWNVRSSDWFDLVTLAKGSQL